MTVTISGTSGITTPGINNSSTLTQTGAVTASNTASFATTISVGAATPASTGAGVTFPASQAASSDANTLDDYEEGTWTPSINFGGGITGITYTEQTGTYVKVGQFVFCHIVLQLSNKGSATGSMNLTGLPFTIANINGNRAAGGFTYTLNGTSISGSPTLLGSGGTTECEVFQSGSNTNISNSNIQNTTAFRAFVIYRASA